MSALKIIIPATSKDHIKSILYFTDHKPRSHLLQLHWLMISSSGLVDLITTYIINIINGSDEANVFATAVPLMWMDIDCNYCIHLTLF